MSSQSDIAMSEQSVNTIDKRDLGLERCLIEHCSPTLASIKTGNLFTISCSDADKLFKQIEECNHCLRKKGVSIVALRKSESKVLLYVYRRDKLEEDFRKPGVACFLNNCGYENIDVDYAVKRLSQKLSASSEFPHEIGLFLGYPLGDVIGFIVNEGRNCKCTGYWKVYCNLPEAEKAFAKFNKCKSVYCRLWQQGRTIQQLTVA